VSELSAYYQLETTRLRLLLKRHVSWLRTRWAAQRDDTWQGVAIPDQWADVLLERGLDSDEEAEFRRHYADSPRIDELSEIVRARRQEMPLGRLARVFDLTPFDCDVLLLALGPELDPSIEILYAYAMDDVGRKYATAQLALALFTDGVAQRFEAQRGLEDDAPLIRFDLLRVEMGPSAGTGFHARPIRVDDRIRASLLGSDSLDRRLLRLTKDVPAIAVPREHEASVEELRRRAGGGECGSLNLTGPADSGKILIAREFFQRCGRTLLQLDSQRFPSESIEREEALRIAAREARLANLAYFLTAVASDPSEKQASTRFLEFVERLEAPVAIDSVERFPCDRILIVAAVQRPCRSSQLETWRAALGDRGNGLDGEIADLVEQFDLGPESITRAAEEVRSRSNGDGGTVSAASLWQACRAQCAWRMEDLAEKLTPVQTWDDIVLPPDTSRQLREIAAQVAHRAEVYERWGFARSVQRGRGISALFSGESGVGKTMAAGVLANHLDLDLYRIDLAGVVSKYIGETEKNLRRIFDAAEQSGAILFFDEADALFGKRTEVKDSHDRYANIEVNYLLQRMEEYRGLAILATNRKSALDRAFLRRLRFLVDVPFPDKAHRRLIWEKSFPRDAPVGDLDLDFLARLEIAGGNIRNVALNAAFLAADRGGPIEFTDVLHAVRREYSKIDKLMTESEFGRHYEGRR
jgi:hypothetical protein